MVALGVAGPKSNKARSPLKGGDTHAQLAHDHSVFSADPGSVPNAARWPLNIFRFIFSADTDARAARDQWRPQVIGKNLISPVNEYGTCFGCEGAGVREFDCRACGGTGKFECRGCAGTGEFKVPARQCFGCNGTGHRPPGTPCPRCAGSGNFAPARIEVCRCRSTEGAQRLVCRRCTGSGVLRVVCRKCSGSGWHRF